ncbi:MAG TPA: M15 family peptidase [Phycisphaerae bacterium]|nr:M15 family peptidase [Phycisphaerae bacterium]
MTLREKQSAFAQLVARLILHAHDLGYAVTLGEAYRSLAEAERLGFVHTLHTQRLAIDLNLFLGGRWLKSTEAHRPLGEWWEAQSTDGLMCCWGGRFMDGNHYSVEHDGLR